MARLSWLSSAQPGQLSRLGRLVVNWRFDAVFSRVWPVLALVFSWSYLLARLLPDAMITKLAGGLGTALQVRARVGAG